LVRRQARERIDAGALVEALPDLTAEGEGDF
jgi:hypothetical protein